MSTQNLRVALWLPTTTPLANEGVVVEDDGDGTEFAAINVPGPAGPAGPIGPQGSPGVSVTGPAGPPNQLIVGTVTTVSPSTPAEVIITGTPPAQTISFEIPQGVQGIQGIQGIPGPPGSGGGVTDHGALTGLGDDDHPQYLTQARADALYDPVGSEGVTDHGALTGLSDDDHPQYLTQARGDVLYAPVGSGLTNGDKGDITISGGGATFTIDPQAVTYAKIQNIATARLLGRATAGAGVAEEITLGTNLSFSGTTLNAAGGGLSDGDKGDITVSGGGTALAIDAQAVTYAKIQNVTTARLLGRATASAGVLEEITLGTNLSFTGTTLNAAGGGGGSPGGSTTQIQFNNAGAFGGDAEFTYDSGSNILAIGNSGTPGVIRGGDGTAAGLTVRAGDATSGAGATLTVRGGNTSVAAAAGGHLALAGGSPGVGGVPGSINMTIPVTGAAAGGSINMTGGRANTAPGGVKLFGGVGSNSASTGGPITLTGGDVGGSSTGGPITIMGGGYSSDFGIQSGSTGGTVTIAGGDMLALGNGVGGNVVIRGGRVTGGYLGNSGDVVVQGGDGLSANAGGNATVRGGTSASGTAGYVALLTAGVERFRILANGAWSVGTAGTATGTTGQVLTSNGNTTPPTWQTPASDARLKDDIADLDLGLAFVRQLRPVSFRWKHDEQRMPHFGLIAQDVLKVLADRECGLVDRSGDRAGEHYGMFYTELIPVLIRAIQQLAQRLPEAA